MENGTWRDWEQMATLENAVPIAGNAGNPMTGNLYLDGGKIEGARGIEVGLEGADQSTFVDFRSSTDPSQLNHSARIIRSSGVDGTLAIDNFGGGNVFVNSGAGIYLAGNFTSVNNTRLVGVANPASSTDAANKAYVDSIGGYGALLGSVSLASGSGSKFIAWNNAWDSYDFIQLVLKDFTGSILGDRVAIGLWDGSSWEGISNTSGQTGQEIFFSPVQAGIASPTSKSSFMYEIGLGSANLVPVLQRSAPGSIPTGQEFSRQGWLKQASHTNGVVSSDYSSWGNSSGLSGKSWGLDLDTGNYTGGTFSLYGFNYPTS